MSNVIITGASRGIGYAIALKLSDTHSVVNISREKTKGIKTYPTDLSCLEGISNVFDDIFRDHPDTDTLINCAGTVEPHGLLEISLEEWKYTISVNLSAAFVCSQEFFKRMKGRSGSIINISSTAGTRAQPGWAAYAASKAGLINLSLTLSEELRPYGIKVWCLAPGRCATDLRKKLAPDENQNNIMQPEEVASFIAILLSDIGHLIDQQVIILRR